MRKITIAWLLVGAAAAAGGCSHTDVGVAATHAPLDTKVTELGGLNTPKFALGDLVVLDPRTHTAWRATTIQTTAADLEIEPAMVSTSEPFASAFEVSFSNSVPRSLRADVADAVNDGTVLHVENYFTRKLKAPVSLALGNDEVSETMIRIRARQPDAHFFLVSQVTSARKVFLASADGSNLVKQGKYEFHVDYPQNSRLEQLARECPAFFKMTPLTLAEKDGRLAISHDGQFSENLARYDFTEAVASSW